MAASQEDVAKLAADIGELERKWDLIENFFTNPDTRNIIPNLLCPPMFFPFALLAAPSEETPPPEGHPISGDQKNSDGDPEMVQTLAPPALSSDIPEESEERSHEEENEMRKDQNRVVVMEQMTQESKGQRSEDKNINGFEGTVESMTSPTPTPRKKPTMGELRMMNEWTKPYAFEEYSCYKMSKIKRMEPRMWIPSPTEVEKSRESLLPDVQNNPPHDVEICEDDLELPLDLEISPEVLDLARDLKKKLSQNENDVEWARDCRDLGISASDLELGQSQSPCLSSGDIGDGSPLGIVPLNTNTRCIGPTTEESVLVQSPSCGTSEEENEENSTSDQEIPTDNLVPPLIESEEDVTTESGTDEDEKEGKSSSVQVIPNLVLPSIKQEPEEDVTQISEDENSSSGGDRWLKSASEDEGGDEGFEEVQESTVKVLVLSDEEEFQEPAVKVLDLNEEKVQEPVLQVLDLNEEKEIEEFDVTAVDLNDEEVQECEPEVEGAVLNEEEEMKEVEFEVIDLTGDHLSSLHEAVTLWSEGKTRVGDWVQASSSAPGKAYYFNVITHEVEWVKPQEWLDYEDKDRGTGIRTKIYSSIVPSGVVETKDEDGEEEEEEGQGSTCQIGDGSSWIPGPEDIEETPQGTDLARFYREDLTLHVRDLLDEEKEREANEIRNVESLIDLSLSLSNVSSQLETSRSVVREKDIEYELVHRRVLFLQQQLAQYDEYEPTYDPKALLGDDE